MVPSNGLDVFRSDHKKYFVASISYYIGTRMILMAAQSDSCPIIKCNTLVSIALIVIAKDLIQIARNDKFRRKANIRNRNVVNRNFLNVINRCL